MHKPGTTINVDDAFSTTASRVALADACSTRCRRYYDPALAVVVSRTGGRGPAGVGTAAPRKAASRPRTDRLLHLLRLVGTHPHQPLPRSGPPEDCVSSGP